MKKVMELLTRLKGNAPATAAPEGDNEQIQKVLGLDNFDSRTLLEIETEKAETKLDEYHIQRACIIKSIQSLTDQLSQVNVIISGTEASLETFKATPSERRLPAAPKQLEEELKETLREPS